LQEDLISDNEMLLKKLADNEEARKALLEANAIATKRLDMLADENVILR